MNYAKIQDDHKYSEVRHRKAENILSNKMVGLGSDELLISDITNTPMELEISSEDECADDMQHLIPSSKNVDCIDSNNKTNDINRNKTENVADDESVWSISIQMFIPFLLAGFGMVAASLLLDVVQVSQR